MPELPEVRTVTSYLNRMITGKKIKEVMILYKPLLVKTSVEDMKTKLVGQTFLSVDPLGKYLIFHLSDNVMISHLRMAGKWVYEEPDNYSYSEVLLEAQFNLEDDANVLRYYDLRRFGTLQLADKDHWQELPAIEKLGYEPFDKRMTPEYLFNEIHTSARPIKVLLLDQTIILGLGNIYANEVLFGARINPLEPGKNITGEDCAAILKASVDILSKAIANGGTTIHNFTWGKRCGGDYQQYLQVHGREGQPCYVCGNKIVKIKVDGRGTYYCPICQPLKK